MYFLSEDERRYLRRSLLPRARELGVAEELRGWQWDRPPLAPIFSPRLGIAEIAGQYCASGRALYLRRVHGIHPPPSPAMVEGAAVHALAAGMVVAAKRIIYQQGAGCLPTLERLRDQPLPKVAGLDRLDEADRAALVARLELLRRYEYHRLMARAEEALARQPHASADALAALALPVVVEQRLDGRLLGLSPHLAVDAFHFAEPMVVDIKVGPRERFHRLATAGYALVLESLYEHPVNLGCVVYVGFEGGRLSLDRDFHLIDDELRQWFVEARDERARLVQEELDPSLPPVCYAGCIFHQVCHGTGPHAARPPARAASEPASARPRRAAAAEIEPQPLPLSTILNGSVQAGEGAHESGALPVAPAAGDREPVEGEEAPAPMAANGETEEAPPPAAAPPQEAEPAEAEEEWDETEVPF